MLAIVLAAILADPFLPAFEYAKRPAAEWIEEFETSGLLDRDALWCVYNHGDRSAENIERLTSWWRRTTDERVKLDLATILNHWDACPEELKFEERFVPDSLGDGRVVVAGRFGPPYVLDGTTDELVVALQGTDPVLRARAAVTLVCRQERIDAVVRTLVEAVFRETQGTWRGAPHTVWEDVDGTLVTSGGTHDAMRRMETVTPREITGHALRWVLDAAGTSADSAIVGLLGDPAAPEDLQRFVARHVGFSRDPDATVLLSLVDRALVRDPLGESLRSQLLDQLGFGFWHVLREHEDWDQGWRWRPLEDADVERLLVELIGRDLEAKVADATVTLPDLQLAGTVAVRSASMHARIEQPLQSLRLRTDDIGAEAQFMLARFAGGAPRPADVAVSLDELVNIVADECEWICTGNRGHAFASSLNALERRGAFDPRAVECCVRVLEAGGLDEGERADAARFLRNAPLTPLQQARVARPGGWMLEPRSLGELWARQGPVCLEGVPVLRDVDSTSYLRQVARITRLLPAERRRLLRALVSGTAVQRREALEDVDLGGLGDDFVRVAVLGRRADCDRRVRAAATALAAQNGWEAAPDPSAVAREAPAPAAEPGSRFDETEATFTVIDALTGKPIERFGLVFGGWRSGPPMPGTLAVYPFPGGVARWPVAVGQTWYEIDAPGYAPATGLVGFDGPGRRHQILRLLQLGGLSGRVRSGDGRPAAGATLRVLRLPHREPAAEVVVAEDGAFELANIPPGRYECTASHPEAGVACVERVRIDPGVLRELGEIRLAPGAELRGRLRDENGGAIPHADVRAVRSWNDRLGTWQTVTDAEGRFAISGLPAGGCELSIEGFEMLLLRRERGDELGSNRIGVLLVGGETRDLDLIGHERWPPADEPPRRPVSLQVLVNGDPVRGLEVYECAAGTWSRIGSTDGLGQLEGDLQSAPAMLLSVESSRGIELERVPCTVVEHAVTTVTLDVQAGELALEFPDVVHVPAEAKFHVDVVPEPAFPGRSRWREGLRFGTNGMPYDLGLVPAGRVVVHVNGVVGRWRKQLEIVAGQENICRLTPDDMSR